MKTFATSLTAAVLIAAFAAGCSDGTSFGGGGDKNEKTAAKPATTPETAVVGGEGLEGGNGSAARAGAGGVESETSPAAAPAPRTWTKAELDEDTRVKWLAHGVYLEIEKGQVAPGDASLQELARRTILMKFDRETAKAVLKKYPSIVSGTLNAAGAGAYAKTIQNTLETAPIIVEEGQPQTSLLLLAELPDDQKDAFAKLDQALDAAQANIEETKRAAEEAKEIAKKAEAEKQAAIAAAAKAQQEAEAAKAAAAAAQQAASNGTRILQMPRMPIFQGSNNVGWLATANVNELSGFRDIGQAFTGFACEGSPGDNAATGIGFVFRSRANGGHGNVWDLARIDEYNSRTTNEPFQREGAAFCLSIHQHQGMYPVLKGWWQHTAGRVLILQTPGRQLPANFIPMHVIGFAFP